MQSTPSVRRPIATACLLLALAGCAASSHVMIGKARPAIPVEQVTLYMNPPPKYEQIAILDSSSQGSMIFTAQGKSDKAIERLKIEAAKLGANGVLYQGSGERPGGSVGVGGGGFNSSRRSGSSIGLGVSGEITNTVAHGIAIYVPPAP